MRYLAAKELTHLGHQVLRLGPPDGLAGHEDGVVSVPDPRSDLQPRRSKDAPSSVPLDRVADLATGDVCRRPGPGREKHYHPTPVNRPAFIEDTPHVERSHRDLVRAGQTVTRARPLRRRAARIERPALVRIRCRKPCTFARWRLFGWYVRLPFAMGDDPRSIGNPAHAGRAGSIRGVHPRWPRLLTTERTSRPLRTRAVWKTAVLSSSPPSPRGA